MSVKNQITGGAFQDAEGNILANGYLTMKLSQDTVVASSGQICGSQKITVPLDANGNISGTVRVWPNDVLSPAGTYYTATAYASNGQQAWGPQAVQVLSNPSPFIISNWVPLSAGSASTVTISNGGLIFADQYPDFATAVAALGTSPGTLIVPSGTYSVSSTIFLYPGQHIIGASSATSGMGTMASPIGAVLLWSGPINSPVIYVQNCHGCSVEGLTIDCHNISGSIGIRYHSTGGTVNASSFNEFKHLNFKGFGAYGFVVGVPSLTPDVDYPAGGFECDTFRLEEFTMLGGSTTATGVLVNSANGAQQSTISRANIQSVNCGIRVVRYNGGLLIDAVTAGSPVGTTPTQFQLDAQSQGVTFINCESEGTFAYALHDSAATGSTAIGNLFFCPVLIDGANEKTFVSIGNTGLTHTFSISGSAFVWEVSNHNLWATDSTTQNHLLWVDKDGARLPYRGVGIGVNPLSNVSLAINNPFITSTSPRGVADLSTYAGTATGTIASFQSGFSTAAATNLGLGFWMQMPTLSGAGSLAGIEAFRSDVTAGAGNYCLHNSGGAAVDFGTGTVLGSGTVSFTGKLQLGSLVNGAMNAGDLSLGGTGSVANLFFHDTSTLLQYNATSGIFRLNPGKLATGTASNNVNVLIKDDGAGNLSVRNCLDTADAGVKASTLNVGTASILNPAGTNIGNLIVDSSANINAFSLSTNQTSTGDYAIPNVFRLGVNPVANSTAFQMGISAEAWTYSTNTKTFSGIQYGSYGSFSHFGSGAANAIYGGSFEGFNAGSGNVTQVCGVNGNASCGGVSAGQPVQTPTNNGTASNLRAVQAHAANLSSGTVTAAQGVYVNSASNTGGGSITTVIGVDVADQIAGVTNYAFRSGLGIVKFNDIVNITGHSNLPTGTSGSFYFGGAYGSPITGKLYVGDGSGWQFNFSKRSASTDTELFQFKDSGNMIASGSITAGSAGHIFTGATSGTTIVQATATATGTLTLPAATDTLVGKATTDNLTNKTLASSLVLTNQTIGIGNGTGTSLTAPAKGTGTGPASLVAVQWCSISLNGSTYWTPLYQ